MLRARMTSYLKDGVRTEQSTGWPQTTGGLLGNLPLAIEQDPAFSCHSRRRRRTDRSPLLGEDHGFVHPRRPCTVRAGSGFRSDLVQLRLVTSSFRSLDADIGKRRAGWVIDADLVGHRPGIARLLLHERAPRGGKNDRTGEQAHCGETNGTTSACLHGFSVEDEGADVVNLTAPLSEPIEGCGIHLKADIRDWIVPVFYVGVGTVFPGVIALAIGFALSVRRTRAMDRTRVPDGTANFGSAAPSSRSARLSTLSHCLTYTLFAPARGRLDDVHRHRPGPQLASLSPSSPISPRKGGVSGPRSLCLNPAAAQVIFNVLLFLPLGAFAKHALAPTPTPHGGPSRASVLGWSCRCSSRPRSSPATGSSTRARIACSTSTTSSRTPPALCSAHSSRRSSDSSLSQQLEHRRR